MNYKKVYIFSLITFIMLVIMFHANVIGKADDNPSQSTDNTGSIITNRYSTVLKTWQSDGLSNDTPFSSVITPSDFILGSNENLSSVQNSEGYGDRVFYWGDSSSVSFNVTVPKTGLYEIYIDYYSLTSDVLPIEISINVNGEIPYFEAQQITLDTFWANTSGKINVDRYGNQVLPIQSQVRKWTTTPIRDTGRLYLQPLEFKLNQGVNSITFGNIQGSLLLGNVTIKGNDAIEDYSQYLQNNQGDTVTGYLDTYQAEKMTMENSASINPGVNRSVGIEPFSVTKLMLNIVDGSTWENPGQAIDWNITVPQSGLYELTFKVQQNIKNNSAVFRTLYINGQIPFSEVEHIPFYYSNNYQNITIADSNNNPYLFYLNKGVNTITLEADATLFQSVYQGINDVMTQINNLSLNIVKLTGNNVDEHRDWNITDYISGLSDTLNGWADQLQQYYNYIYGLNGFKNPSPDLISLKISISMLQKLAEKPNDLPKNLSELSQGTDSVYSLLGNILPDIILQPLNVDCFYVHGSGVKLPSTNTSFFANLWVGIERFFLSFFDNAYNQKPNSNDLQVWVERPTQYVDLMQQMTDEEFTPKTGIKVDFSIMPAENKLILANSADKQPDIAMGISSTTTWDLAMRGALFNFRQESNFDNFINIYEPGALLPMIYDNGVYGMPETQNFYVLFYRKDILDELNIPVPQTWNDVIGMLPELQRYGMNFYIPLASSSAYKTLDTTAPFFYEFGGSLYGTNGLSTAIDSANSVSALTFMTELFTIYSLPQQAGSFYQHFIDGMMPIGIADFGTYVQLMTAAPQISGLWDIALLPGVQQSDGTINRDAPGTGQDSIVFEKSNKKDEAWSFLQWWMSTGTQVSFANNLMTTLGPAYMWNTANIDAFAELSWPAEDKKTILKQWSSLYGIPNIPGSYMEEREISNIWNEVVFNGENLQNAISDATITINKEVESKGMEFGYIDQNGNIIKNYPVPTIAEVEGWMNSNGGN